MITIHHINCGILHSPPNPQAICHCLLLEDKNGLALVDTGIGLKEVYDPIGRISKELIELAGFQFHEQLTAIRQVEKMGFQAYDVKHIILTHCDNVHAGGLADFPNATVHVSDEEYKAFQKSSYRYLPQLFRNNPTIQAYSKAGEELLGLEARKLQIPFSGSIYLIPLFGYTLGHCGVAIQQGTNWVFHIGDAYYQFRSKNQLFYPYPIGNN